MKMYLVEFECLVDSGPVIKIFAGESEDDCWLQAVEYAEQHDWIATFSFDMYRILRKPNGELYIEGDWIV